MIIIADATPLIYLHRIGQLDLLRSLFGRVYIPSGVARELQSGHSGEPTIPELDWIEGTAVQNQPAVDILAQELDRGEAEVLALALERSADWVIMDDSLARTAASLLQIRCMGTIGILITCKARGFITTVKEPLDAMMAAGLWISPSLYEQTLHKIGEL
jgi:predicted nucleic acid-binding protein